MSAEPPRVPSPDEAPAEAAVEELTTMVYAELRTLARRHLARERPGHTLQTTALVHEAFLRLREQREVEPADEGRFLILASHAIRRILVDHARGRARIRRGGDRERVSLDENEPATAPFDVLVVSDLLDRLASIDRLQAQVVELRVFGGLPFLQIGEALGISTGKAHGEWRMARAWLLVQLERTS